LSRKNEEKKQSKKRRFPRPQAVLIRGVGGRLNRPRNKLRNENRLTDEGQDDEEDVEAESRAGGGEEVRDGADLDDDGGNGGGEQQLEREDDVDLADERPAHLGRLLHPRVQRAGPRRGRPRLEVAVLLVAEHLRSPDDLSWLRRAGWTAMTKTI
jgi:hypothetical protein